MSRESIRTSILGICALALGLMGPSSNSEALRARQFPSRPLDNTERYEKLVDESDLLLIARIQEFDSTTSPVRPANFDIREGMRRRRSILEPVEWLRGGLEGDLIEVFTREWDPPGPGVTGSSMEPGIMLPWPSWGSIAGSDSLGVLVQLERSGSDWYPRNWSGYGMDAGFRVLPQRSFKTVRDSIVVARDRLGIDSLVARADLIVVVADSVDIVKTTNLDHRHVRVVRRLKGEEGSALIDIQPWLHYRAAARSVLFLKRVDRSTYEPIPFHRKSPPTFNDWDSEWERQPFATETAVLRAIERLESARAGQPSER